MVPLVFCTRCNFFIYNIPNFIIKTNSLCHIERTICLNCRSYLFLHSDSRKRTLGPGTVGGLIFVAVRTSFEKDMNGEQVFVVNV